MKTFVINKTTGEMEEHSGGAWMLTTDYVALEKRLMGELNAAQILKGYIWGKLPHEKLKFTLNKENKIEVEQQEILDLLMDFQEWQLLKISELTSEFIVITFVASISIWLLILIAYIGDFSVKLLKRRTIVKEVKYLRIILFGLRFDIVYSKKRLI